MPYQKRLPRESEPTSCLAHAYACSPWPPLKVSQQQCPLFQLDLVLGAILWLLSLWLHPVALTNCLVCSSGIVLHLTACVMGP